MNTMTNLRSGLLLGSLVLAMAPASAQIGINSTAVAPNNRSILDLSDASRGLLLPRMTRAERVAIVAPAPANGLLVYQTDDFPNTPPALPEPKGLWYRDGATWVRVGSGGPAWQLGGNAGTNPTTNFVGTTDAQDLSIRTNGLDRMRIVGTGTNVGFVGVNQVTPQERLEVNGALRQNGTTATANAGDIRFNAATGAHDGYTDNALAYPATGWYQLENVFGNRPKEPYISQGGVTCNYPTGSAGPGAPNSNVTLGPNPWPLIDNAAYTNVNTFGTLETPYSLFWEDGRHQYLYLDDDFIALNICANTNINGVAFQATGNGTIAMQNSHVRMKNTNSAAQTSFDLAGLQDCMANVGTPLNIVTGWNIHYFNVAPFQWTGNGWNVLVEFSFDNQNWTSNVAVQAENTPYVSNYGLYCDACGHQFTPGSSTCYWTAAACGGGTAACTAPSLIAPGGVAWPPTGQSAAPGILCGGWGHTPGPFLTTTSSLTTCDCTFQYIGAQGSFSKRPLLRLYAQNTGVTNPQVFGDYMVARQGVMIGANAWTTGGVFPNQNFKGPGTISAQKAVFANGVMLSDHVFDSYFDGALRPEDAAAGKAYEHMPIREMANYVEKERHLPTMQGREAWNSTGAFSVDNVTNQLWVTLEAQALYIQELNARTQALQRYLVEKRLKALGVK